MKIHIIFLSLLHSTPFPHTHTPYPPTQSIRRKEGEINQQLMRSREWETGPSRHFHLWCTLPCYYNLCACVSVCSCVACVCVSWPLGDTTGGLNKAKRRAGKGGEGGGGEACDKGASKQTWHVLFPAATQLSDPVSVSWTGVHTTNTSEKG